MAPNSAAKIGVRRKPYAFAEQGVERKYDEKFQVVSDAIRQLMAPPPAAK